MEMFNNRLGNVCLSYSGFFDISLLEALRVISAVDEIGICQVAGCLELKHEGWATGQEWVCTQPQRACMTAAFRGSRAPELMYNKGDMATRKRSSLNDRHCVSSG